MSRSGKKVTKFVTFPNSAFPGLYELQEERFEVPNPGKVSNLNCECCHERMKPVMDIQQLGFWQDHFNTYFACVACLKVVMFTYDLSRVEVTPDKRRAKKAARSAV